MDQSKPWGPENPHPLSRMRTELVWEGKYDEYGRRREVQLPAFPLVLQKVETIDEPRDREKAQQGTLFDEGAFQESAHRDDFRNRLIWGDNKLTLVALLNEFRGKVKLIYIDPPFDVGADFTLPLDIGEEGASLGKDQSLIEAVAYRDIWGQGFDSYAQYIYERMSCMRDLLSPDGTIYVHVGLEVSNLARFLLNEVFGSHSFVNEIAWKRGHAHSDSKQGSNHFGRIHETLLVYSKTESYTWNQQYTPYEKDYIDKYYKFIEPGTGRRYWLDNIQGPGGAAKGNPKYEVMGVERYWRYSREKMQQLIAEGRIVQTNPGTVPKYKRYLDEMPGRPLQDVWDDVRSLAGLGGSEAERTSYPTQKPKQLLERIIATSSNEGDLVADFFCGSGTTLAVAEEMGRKWIGCDLGRYAIHTTRKRLIGIQRQLRKASMPYRSFDIYNLGRYERQWWQAERLKGANEEHRATVLRFFRATPSKNPASGLIHGTKGAAYVHVDNIDSIFTIIELREVAKTIAAIEGIEDWQNHGNVFGSRSKPKLIVLAWEFEMDLRRRVDGVEAETGVEITLKYIPREIMEPNRDTVQFFDAAALDAEPMIKSLDGNKVVDVKLTNFYPALTEVPDKELEALKERAIKSPFDFIDFWAVDFEYREDKPFEHHWQDYRTRKDRSLKTVSDLEWTYESGGTKRICVKVIDVFGIDTTKVIEVKL